MSESRIPVVGRVLRASHVHICRLHSTIQYLADHFQ